MTLIGSGALLLHAHLAGLDAPLSENSMDVDPVVDGDLLAWACYDACIGSDFEKENGWHVNIMPESVLRELPSGWEDRAGSHQFGNISLTLPTVPDLLSPKVKRGEPRDLAHVQWAIKNELLPADHEWDHDEPQMEH